MDRKNRPTMTYRSMTILAVIVGIIAFAFQFLRDFELLSFMLSVAVLGGLIGGSSGYEERERRRLDRSYKTTLEWLLLAVMAAYALIELSSWLGILQSAMAFLNARWPVLILSVLCLFMGLAGLQKPNPA